MFDLLFSLPAAISADLVFGDDGVLAESGDDSTITFFASLPTLGASGAFVYESAAQRPVVAAVSQEVMQAQACSGEVVVTHQVAAFLLGQTTVKNDESTDLSSTVSCGHDQAVTVAQESRFSQQLARKTQGWLTSSCESAIRHRSQASAASSNTLRLGIGVAAPNQDAIRDRRRSFGQQHSEARHIAAWRTTSAGRGGAQVVVQRDRHAEGVQPQPMVIFVGPEPPVDTPCYRASTHLLFRFNGSDSALVFVCDNYSDPVAPTPGIAIPKRAIYMAHNNVSLVVADTGQPLAVAGELRLGIDRASWVWGWSATVPAVYLPILSSSSGKPVELIASINGEIFRLLVVNADRQREFGGGLLEISGQGKAAFLADPFDGTTSRSNDVDMTAQQLMAQTLTDNGVSIGWDIDWAITDWVVPAGVWHHLGTSMDALLTIAHAAGAYIQAHPAQQVLHVLPEYPLLPWEWDAATPDVEIPEDICITEGISWLSKPNYNSVFVSGLAGGVQGRVVRNGTAGDRPAPMVTDALITHADAVRQNGRRILADVGRQKIITLSMPLAEAGIIKPGKLIRYNEGGQQHIGLSRAVSVSAVFPKVRQSVTIESHVL